MTAGDKGDLLIIAGFIVVFSGFVLASFIFRESIWIHRAFTMATLAGFQTALYIALTLHKRRSLQWESGDWSESVGWFGIFGVPIVAMGYSPQAEHGVWALTTVALLVPWTAGSAVMRKGLLDRIAYERRYEL